MNQSLNGGSVQGLGDVVRSSDAENGSVYEAFLNRKVSEDAGGTVRPATWFQIW